MNVEDLKKLGEDIGSAEGVPDDALNAIGFEASRILQRHIPQSEDTATLLAFIITEFSAHLTAINMIEGMPKDVAEETIIGMFRSCGALVERMKDEAVIQPRKATEFKQPPVAPAQAAQPDDTSSAYDADEVANSAIGEFLDANGCDCPVCTLSKRIVSIPSKDERSEFAARIMRLLDADDANGAPAAHVH